MTAETDAKNVSTPGKAGEEIIERFREAAQWLPEEAVAEARKSVPDMQGFAIFPVYAPVEIVHAAGLLPVGLFGAGGRVELSYAESRFQSFICSIAKSTLELFLRNKLQGFTGVVFSSICDVARNLASLVKRNAPELYVEYLHLPQNMYSKRSAAYTRSEFERFRRNLSQHLGRSIPDAAVMESLQLYNALRRQLHRLYRFRKEHPCAISAAELYAVVRGTTRLRPEESLPLLERLCKEVETREVRERDGVKVVIEGAFCEQPPLGLLEVIEAGGCLVQDDDLLVGWRQFADDVPSNGNPVAALADAYLSRSVYTSVRHDRNRPRTQGLLDRMKEAGAEAVLFTPAKFCEPALLDYVLFRRTLDQADVPHLKVEFEEKMWSFEATRTEVETFAESMLFD